MRTGGPASSRPGPLSASSAIPRRGSSRLPGPQKTVCGSCGRAERTWYDRQTRRVRDLPSGDLRIYLEFDLRRINCRRYGACSGSGSTGWRTIRTTPSDSRSLSASSVGARRSTKWRRTSASTGTRSRRWTSTTCVSSSRARASRGPRVVGSRFAKGTSTASWSATWSGRSRSGSAAMDRSEASMAMFYDWLGPSRRPAASGWR